MLHVPIRKNPDAASTVTDLIADLNTRKPSWPEPDYSCSTLMQSSKECRSSTKLLRNYIKNYDRSQTRDLAKALTCQAHLKLDHTQDKEIDKEISYAKNLLCHSSRTIVGEDLRSMTTDDLLTMPPCSNGEPHSGKASNGLVASHLSDLNDFTMETIPNMKKVLTSSKKSECSESMRFSEIASANFFSRASTESPSGDSNLFSLNGVSYTPYSVKYKSLLEESKQKPISRMSPHHATESRVTFSYSSADDSSETITRSPVNLTAHAGRTPFKSRTKICYESGDETLESTKDALNPPYPESEFSSSHYSVPISLHGETEAMQQFMETCLDEGEVSKSATTSGSVETLKNMIFTLQSINSGDTNRPTQRADAEASKETDEIESGPSSLRKAFSHLANLKDLLA